MKEKQFTSFAEFWPFYMSQHQDGRSRALHYGGSLLSLGLLVGGMASGQGFLCWLAIPAGYAPAWIGHYLVEKNRPATFQYPLYSLLADYVMLFRFLSGGLGPHLTRKGI